MLPRTNLMNVEKEKTHIDIKTQKGKNPLP